MRTRIVRRLSAAVALGLMLGGCGGGGSSAIDLNGAYRWSVTFTESGCGGAVGETRTDNVTVQQNGDSVTFFIPADTGRADVPISGTIDGDQVHATGTYQNPPWALVLDIDATANGGGDSLAGTMDFTWVNTADGGGCVERAAFTAARI